MKFKSIKKFTAFVVCSAICFSNTTLSIGASDRNYHNYIIPKQWYETSFQNNTISLHDGDILNLVDLNEEAAVKIVVESNANVKIIGASDKFYKKLNIFCENDAKLAITDLRFYSTPSNYDDTNKYLKGAIVFKGGQNNKLIISGKNEVLNVASDVMLLGYGAGVLIEEGAYLYVLSENENKVNENSLKVVGVNGGAGIGGGYQKSAGKISFENVKIVAEGAGAGIGGGYDTVVGGSLEEATFYNCIIKAVGKNGAGIGGGASIARGESGQKKYFGGNGGDFRANFSKIEAIGEKGAGIGGGMADVNNSIDFVVGGGNIGEVNITNTEIKAIGNNGAGIGGGKASVQGSLKGTAYGGGHLKDVPSSGIITINNANETVQAEGTGGAGIGGGYAFANLNQSFAIGGEMKQIVVKNGVVNTIGNDGAGIGGGNADTKGNANSQANGGNGGKIEINDGNVRSKGFIYGAAIGGGGAYSSGYDETSAVAGDGGIIKIFGGNVTVVSDQSDKTGSGIGGGFALGKNTKSTKNIKIRGGSGGEISITGGKTTVDNQGGTSRSSAIGGGGAFSDIVTKDVLGGNGGNIAIIYNAIVKVNDCYYSRNFGAGSANTAEKNSGGTVNDNLSQVFISTSNDLAITPSIEKVSQKDPKAYLQTTDVTFQKNGVNFTGGEYSVKNPFAKSSLGSYLYLGKPNSSSKMYISYYGIIPPDFTFNLNGYKDVKVNLGDGYNRIVNFAE